MTDSKKRLAPRVIYPQGVEQILDVSKPTRWRMEREGRLPARDVFIGGVAVGWKPETIDRALSTPNPEKDQAMRAVKAANVAKAHVALAANRAARKGARIDRGEAEEVRRHV
jgi:predicted DNA-binding transcriptional regulator AlpA